MWLVFTLITTLLWGLAELFYKKGAREDEPYSHLKISVFVGAAMGLHALVTLAMNGFEYDWRNLIVYLPVSLCYILSMTLSYFGMRYIEESISDPVENTSGALCSLLCVLFLHETISGISAAAIAVMAVGVLGVGFLERTGTTDRSKKLGRVLAAVAFAMPFCYAILDALGSFLDVYYLDAAVSPLLSVTEDTIEETANTAYELTFALFAVGLFIFLKAKHVKFDLPRQKDKALAAVFETGGQLTYVYAMSGNGAIAAPIISSVCVVSLVLSRIFLHEKLEKKQYIFIGLVLVGIVTLAIAEGG